MAWEKLHYYEQFRMNEYGLLAASLGKGMADIMMNKTHRDKEDWVDLTEKTVKETKVSDFLSQNVNGWHSLSQVKKDEIIDFVTDDFERKGYEIK